MRPSRWLFWLAASLVVTVSVARAEHYAITLTVEDNREKAEAHADDSPPAGGLYARPVFHGRSGESLTMQFFMTDENPHSIVKQVTVRYYLASIPALGKKALPDLDKDVEFQGDFSFDFKPDAKVGLKQQFQLDRPGIYLLRVESLHSQSDHEHFSAIELEMK